MTLSELKTLIQNYTENTETTFVNSLDDFIKNAENRIFDLVQFDYFRKNVTGSLTTGNTYLTTPTDYQLSFSLAVVDSNGDYHYLDKKHPSFMREYNVDPTDLYKPNSLVTDTTGTWLSNNARNALLYGSLIEAYIFMKGEQDLLQAYEQRFASSVNRLKNRAEARGRRDEYRYDSLRTSVS
jgi:hypothetical protein